MVISKVFFSKFVPKARYYSRPLAESDPEYAPDRYVILLPLEVQGERMFGLERCGNGVLIVGQACYCHADERMDVLNQLQSQLSTAMVPHRWMEPTASGDTVTVK